MSSNVQSRRRASLCNYAGAEPLCSLVVADRFASADILAMPR